MIDNYTTFVLLAITVTAIPGPAILLTIKNTLVYGVKISVLNIMGNFFAMVILATISAIGLGAVILTSQTLFYGMKILGCLYLIYLGLTIFKAPVTQATEIQPSNKEAKKIFQEGFIIGISNPKAIAFFTALFPQFIDPSRTFITQFMTLILTIEGISFIILLAYAFLASKSSVILSQKKYLSWFNKLTAVCFIGFGLALLYKE